MGWGGQGVLKRKMVTSNIHTTYETGRRFHKSAVLKKGDAVPCGLRTPLITSLQ